MFATVVCTIHLELVLDLTAKSFVCCLKCFSSRRDVPQIICSDNSKTFRSANNIISSILGRPEAQHHFRGRCIKWKLILENAPWWGGFYERMTQSIMRYLQKVIGKAVLAYDELAMVLADVEATLNSRPISYLSSEDIGEPLTQSQLLSSCRLLPDLMDHKDDPTFGDPDPKKDLTWRMWHLSQILEHFWRWRNEYLNGMRESHCYCFKSKPVGDSIAVGDVVLIYDPGQPRTYYQIGRVVKLLPGSDGAVRGASLQV